MTTRVLAPAATRYLSALAGHPGALRNLEPPQWDLLVRQALCAGLLARLCYRLEDMGALNQVPQRPRQHLLSARAVAEKHSRDVRWEITCVCQALAPLSVPITLLKGAAYTMAALPPARGRLFSDIDLLVPRDRIEEVERALIDADWSAIISDPYDQYYYRRWTHQIPPLQHYKRSTILDVHHTIVPLTARAPVAPDRLAAQSQSLGDSPLLRVLGPADMVLHSAVHLFNEGEFERGLRDLLDLCDLLGHFGTQPEFWDALATRAEELGLTTPLILALRYRYLLLDLAPPPVLEPFIRRRQPPAAARAAFDVLFCRALLPNHSSCDDVMSGTARWLLYLRAHYLRMPLNLLIPHLLRKALPRRSNDQAVARRQRPA